MWKWSIPCDVVTSCFNVVNKCLFRNGLGMFRFPVVNSLPRFSNVKSVAVPATSFANDWIVVIGWDCPSMGRRIWCTECFGKYLWRYIPRRFRNIITLLQLWLLITLKQVVTASNETILTFWRPARLTSTIRLRRPCLFKSYSQHWMPMSAWRAFTISKTAFPLCPCTDGCRLKRLLNFYCRCFLSRFQAPIVTV